MPESSADLVSMVVCIGAGGGRSDGYPGGEPSGIIHDANHNIGDDLNPMAHAPPEIHINESIKSQHIESVAVEHPKTPGPKFLEHVEKLVLMGYFGPFPNINTRFSFTSPHSQISSPASGSNPKSGGRKQKKRKRDKSVSKSDLECSQIPNSL